MDFISTRGSAPAASFPTVILEGLAPDRGLYVPRTVPRFTAKEIGALLGADLTTLTIEILRRFAGDALSLAQLRGLLGKCHDRFTHPAITPLVQIGPKRWVMELFHGPTLAFKDLAMQVLGPLMGHFLDQAGRSATIIGATSGDTGGAALAAFADVRQVRALFLYPEGGVSAFQAAQMQALSRPDLRAVPVLGTFDDCQMIVKSLLATSPGQGLTAVNSVNWGRILAQSAYFARAALTLGSAGRSVHFVVPTGNFGNLYAGLLAREMGFPVGALVVATNANDSLHQLISSGRCENGEVLRTHSPAMDIRVPSNLERLIHDLAGPETTRTLFAGPNAGALTLPPGVHAALANTLLSARVSDEETISTLRAVQSETGYLADPHTAVALAASRLIDLLPGEVVALSTAHPVKFTETVAQALGVFPAHLARPLPSPAVTPITPIPPDLTIVRAMLDAVQSA